MGPPQPVFCSASHRLQSGCCRGVSFLSWAPVLIARAGAESLCPWFSRWLLLTKSCSWGSGAALSPLPSDPQHRNLILLVSRNVFVRLNLFVWEDLIN